MPSLLKRCYLPGYFCPPTEKDLQIAYWLGRKQSEISEVVIVIGEEKNALVPAKVNQQIFDLYIHETNGDIVKTQLSGEDSPRHYIYKILESNVEEPFIIAIPEKVAKSHEFQNKFRKFHNYEIILIPEYNYGIRGEMMQSVIDENMKEFMKYIPPELSKLSVQKVFDMLREQVDENNGNVINVGYLQGLYEKFGVK
jgi:hypothetical protein